MPSGFTHSAARRGTSGPTSGAGTHHGSRGSAADSAASPRRTSAMVRPKGPDTAVSCPPLERSGKAAFIGGIADGARDVRAVRQVPDAGRHGRRRAARGSAGRQRRIAGIARFAMNGVACEPPQ
ncbi:hypothetical protein G6F57_021562 [Rhizopus arrhizus]|nr:hypothetical protein G6F57_021562 [Rhizopus arrhizus]